MDTLERLELIRVKEELEILKRRMKWIKENDVIDWDAYALQKPLSLIEDEQHDDFSDALDRLIDIALKEGK